MAVTLYSTPSCGFCTKAKAFFRERHIPFTEYNVTADPRKAEEMLHKSHQMGVPVIDIHGKVIVGFNQPEIERALKR